MKSFTGPLMDQRAKDEILRPKCPDDRAGSSPLRSLW